MDIRFHYVCMRTVDLLMSIMWGLQRSADADQTLLGIVAIPPEGQLYHGVFPGGATGEEDDITPADLKSYEQLAGKSAAWVYFSHNWRKGGGFPLGTASWISETGSIPFVRLMLRSSLEQNRPERTFNLNRILEGDFDTVLRAWARGREKATETRLPLMGWSGFEMPTGTSFRQCVRKALRISFGSFT